VRQRVDVVLKAALAAVLAKEESETNLLSIVEARVQEANALRVDLSRSFAQLTEVSESVECPLCMERQAGTALSCGHCYCCEEGCPSAELAKCPTCNTAV
jgi:hypothetical protein